MGSRSQFNALAARLGLKGQPEPPAPPRREVKVPEGAKGETRSNKFRARRVVIDGIKFASQKEGRQYLEFKRQKAEGEILAFVCHPVYYFVHNGKKIGKYTADFRVLHIDGQERVYDVKGGKATITEAYRLRCKMMWAFFDIKVIEL